MNKLIFPVILLILSVSAYSQSKQDSLKTALWGNPVSIYEYGAPLTSCETNFLNLFNNWNTEQVTNAREYQLLDFKFVETLSDKARYNYYRNYFSGAEAFGSSGSSFNSSSSKMKTLNGKAYNEETKISERFVWPTYIHRELFDQRGVPAEGKKLLSEEFVQQARELLLREINIDTLDLKYSAGEIFRIDTIRSDSEFFGNNVRKKHLTYNLASTDTISKDYININLNTYMGKPGLNYNDLSIEKRRALALEEILIERINMQVGFNKLVHIGDKVYAVNFRYHGALYTAYVICNPDTKKVVMDNFFKNITIRTVN